MKNKKEINLKFLSMLALIIILAAAIISGCEPVEGSSVEAGETGHSESGGEECEGEHGGTGEGSGEASEAGHSETSGEGEESGEGGGGNALMPNETYDVTSNGARLILAYDASSNSFVGTVKNTTNSTLTRVRVGVHLSNSTELGPTTPTDLAPGEIIQLTMPATSQAFDSWSTHAEVGSSEGGAESGEGNSGGNNETGEIAGHPEGGEGGNEGSSAELNENEMSSPIIPLGQSWNGILGELEVSMQYDAATQSVYGTVKNIATQKLCYVQAEPHLKSGSQTVGELGPEKLGDLNPGQKVNSSLSVDSEPSFVGVAFDGYVIHMEVFDCNGPGPVPHTGGEGNEGGSANALMPNEAYDVTSSGARMVMVYDAPTNTFIGMVINTTSNILTQVRVEVHLSNGMELGPTNPIDLAPGEVMPVRLLAPTQAFDTWSPHAEVGSSEGGESGGTEGNEGSEGGHNEGGDGDGG